ncbi:membrane protein insertion efficiency factor YidD [Thiofilum flexile]|uniref:membrane protein insertion efficiency factor YidD n=1 Tax=Thiofilum flexile TaxID=125627 RepID=UPI00036C5D2A|nr:membrane protein insertion efficiency factor YidD [Thiofilum flexile]
MSLATPSAIAAIDFYQRFISPYKGFRCAHAVLHRGDSCSQAVKKLIAEHGVWQSRALIRARFMECRVAFELLKQAPLLSTREDEDNKREKVCKDYLTDCASEIDCEVVGNLISKPKNLDCMPDICVPDICSCGSC